MQIFRLCGENRRIHLVRKPSLKSNSSHSTSTVVDNGNASYSDETDPAKLKEKLEQLQKDIHRFINRIAELEKEKEALNKEIDRRKKLESIKKESTSTPALSTLSKFNPQTATLSELRSKANELMKDNSIRFRATFIISEELCKWVKLSDIF